MLCLLRNVQKHSGKWLETLALFNGVLDPWWSRSNKKNSNVPKNACEIVNLLIGAHSVEVGSQHAPKIAQTYYRFGDMLLNYFSFENSVLGAETFSIGCKDR